MGQPMGAMPTSPMSMPAPIPQYASQPTASYAPPIYSQGTPSYAPPAVSKQIYAQPQYGQPQYGQPQYGQPQYGQPRVVQQAPVQYQQAPKQAPQAPAEKITVMITGRTGVNDVINGTFQSCGEQGGRYCFEAPTNEGPIYLYYDQAADNWCIGDQIGSQSYYGVCGPSNGEDMAQEWRVWTGDAWESDPKITAVIN
jgi:hypothetical protein